MNEFLDNNPFIKKRIMNSFYETYIPNKFCFTDPLLAEKTTECGRDLLQKLLVISNKFHIFVS